MKCAQYLSEPNTLASTPSQAPREFELSMTPVGIPMSNLTNISVESTDTSNDAVKPDSSNTAPDAVPDAAPDDLPQDQSRPLFDLSDYTAPTFPLEPSNHSAEQKSETKDPSENNMIPDDIPTPAEPVLPTSSEKNDEIQMPPDPPPEVRKLPKPINPETVSAKSPEPEPQAAKLSITPPSVDNSIVALKRLENRARRTRIAATTKPPTARGYRFT